MLCAIPSRGAKFARFGIHQALGISVLSADENLRRAAAQIEVAVGVADIHERAHVLVTHAVSQRRGRRQPPRVLRVSVRIPLAQIHLRNARLPLPRCREPQFESSPAPTRVPSFTAYSVVKPFVNW